MAGAAGALTQLQREFLEKALAFYEEFAAERGGPAGAHERRGPCRAWGLIRLRLKQLAEAETALRRVAGQEAGLVRQHPDRVEFRVELARLGSSLSTLCRETRRTKDAALEAARAHDELAEAEGRAAHGRRSRERLAGPSGTLSAGTP